MRKFKCIELGTRISTALIWIAVAVWLPTASAACPETERVVRFGFFTDFAPISYSADPDPASPYHNTHQGYEADLVTAIETMKGVNLSFEYSAIDQWDRIWLKSAQPEFDMIGGGITALESRTMDASGTTLIRFTAGHIRFHQSLLVRSEDKERLSSYRNLDDTKRIYAFRGTTTEAHLLKSTGLSTKDGRLAAGVRVVTPNGTVIANGGDDLFIAAHGASPILDNRMSLHSPSSSTMPEVVYDLGDTEPESALQAGRIDGIQSDEIENHLKAQNSDGALVISIVDGGSEIGAFSVAVSDTALAGCLNEAVEWLTDGRKIGYAEWVEDSTVFLKRAKQK